MQKPFSSKIMLGEKIFVWRIPRGIVKIVFQRKFAIVLAIEGVNASLTLYRCWTRFHVYSKALEHNVKILMSLARRLGLERGKSAREAMDVICSLLDRHGQGGNCSESRNQFTYHNSFLVADRSEAWILETAGPHWAAEQIKCMCCRSKVNALKLFPLGYWDYSLSEHNGPLSTIWIKIYSKTRKSSCVNARGIPPAV